MAANSSLSLTALDVPTLEADLKAFMSSQKQFKDYNFDGSNLSALIRLLSYNTFKNSFYLNMVMSEGFLDTAQTRPAILSHAKELNYVPVSARSAKATVNFSFNGTQPSYLITKGQTFSSTVKNTGLVFSVPSPILLTSSNGYFSVQTDVYEGPFVADSYIVNYSDQTQRFLISNPNIDTTSLTVMVYQDSNVAGMIYTLATSLLDLNAQSKVFFLQAAETGQYEIQFGDGVSGYRPPDGSTVVLDYRITQGDFGNGATQFNMNFALGVGVSNISKVSTIAPANGGANIESIDSIRYNAPRHFQIQERATGPDDYATILQQQFPEITAAQAYGGEEAIPPQYGKVFIAINIANVDGIPASKSTIYTEFLRKRCSLTIRPVFVVPDYIGVAIRSHVTYNINVTTLTPDNISALVYTAIQKYATTNLNNFNATMKFSKLSSTIDAADPSIDHNDLQMYLYRKYTLTRSASSTFVANFSNALLSYNPITNSVFPTTYSRSVFSTSYINDSGVVYLTDDGAGNIWVAQDRGTQTFLLSKTGTVDYKTGTITISQLVVNDYSGSWIKIYTTPLNQDIVPSTGTILKVEADEIQIGINGARL